MKKRLPCTLFFPPSLLLALAMTGCDTSEGIGRDLQDAGEAIEEAAQDAQEEDDAQ